MKKIFWLFFVFTSLILAQNTKDPFSITGWDTLYGKTDHFKLPIYRLKTNPGGWINRSQIMLDTLLYNAIVYTDTSQLVILNDTLRLNPNLKLTGVDTNKNNVIGIVTPDSVTHYFSLNIWKVDTASWKDSLNSTFVKIDSLMYNSITYIDTTQLVILNDTLRLNPNLKLTGNTSGVDTSTVVSLINAQSYTKDVSDGRFASSLRISQDTTLILKSASNDELSYANGIVTKNYLSNNKYLNPDQTASGFLHNVQGLIKFDNIKGTDISDFTTYLSMTADDNGINLTANGTGFISIGYEEQGIWTNHYHPRLSPLVNLDSLSNVYLSTKQDGQYLKWDSEQGKWTNGYNNITNLNSLSDVTITTPTAGQVLKYNGTEWANATVTDSSGNITPSIAFTQLTDVPTSYSGNANKTVAVNS